MKKLSMKVKLILFCLFIVILPISVSYFFFTEDIIEIVETSNERDMFNMLQLVAKNLENNIELVNSISDAIYLDTNFCKKLFREYEDTGASVNLYLQEADTLITKNRSIYQRIIQSISIYTNNETIIKDGDVIKALTIENYEDIGFTSAMLQNGIKVWGTGVTKSETAEDSYSLSLYRKLKNSYNNYVGILEIQINEKEFFRSMLETTNQIMFIVNKDEFIVSSNDSNYIGKTINSFPGLNRINADAYGKFNCEIEGQEKSILYQTYFEDKKGEQQWKVVMLGSFDEQDRMYNSFARRGIAASSICFFLMVVVIIMFSEGISHRIKKLVKQTERIVNKDYSHPVLDDGEDEIGQLAKSFNKMQKHLNTLIYEVYEQKIEMQTAQLKQKETEFLALQNQINPHFLYNTLDAIRMEAIINKDESAGDMILSLSALLRYNTVNGKAIVRLKDELDNLGNYIHLMNMKYENAICFHVDVPEDLYEYKIVKFIFQPIVENSFKHGMVATRENAAISIRAQANEETLSIEISDNGVGMTREQVLMLNHAMKEKEDHSQSIGIRNVNQRIQYHCGEEYGLSIESTEGVGTVVRISLSVIREVKDNDEGIISR